MIKFISVFIFVTCLISGTNAQPVIQWQHSFGGSDHETILSIKQTFDSGYILAGNTSSNDFDVIGQHGSYDNWIIKLDNAGSVEWKNCYGGTSGEELKSIVQTSDSGYIVTGYSSSSNGDVSGGHGSADFWVYKLDKTGTLQWQKCLGGTGDDQGKYGTQTHDGGYIVTGWTNSVDGDVLGLHGSFDVWVVKLDSSGGIEWQKCYGGSAFDFASGIEETSDHGYIIGGRTSSNDGDVSGLHGFTEDYWVVKIDSIGGIFWQKCLGGSGSEEFYAIQQTNDRGYFLCGRTESNNGDVSGSHGNVEGWVVKLDSSGNMEWQKCIGGSGYDAANAMCQTNDNGFIVSGYAESNNGDVSGNHGNGDLWIIKLNNLGVPEWQKCLGGTIGESGYAIRQTNDDGFIVGGLSYSSDGDATSNNGVNDYWVVKLSSITSVHESINISEFEIYPNPATKNIHLTFQNEKDEGELKIVNAMGQQFYSSNVSGLKFALDINLIPGIYFVSVSMKSNVYSKKLIID